MCLCVCVMCVCVWFLWVILLCLTLWQSEKKEKRSRRTCSTRWVHVAFWMSSKWKLLHNHKCGKHTCVRVFVCVADITATLLAFDEAPKRIFQLRGSCGKLTNGNSDVATGSGNWHILRLIWFPFKCRYKWPVIFMLRQWEWHNNGAVGVAGAAGQQ